MLNVVVQVDFCCCYSNLSRCCLWYQLGVREFNTDLQEKLWQESIVSLPVMDVICANCNYCR